MLKFVKILNKFFGVVTAIIALAVGVFGIMVYTPEYNKEGSELKAFFEQPVSYNLSLLLTIIIIGVISILVCGICKSFFMRLNNFLEEQEILLAENKSKPYESSSFSEEMQIYSAQMRHEKLLKTEIERFANLRPSVISVQLYKYKEIEYSKNFVWEITPTLLMYAKDNYPFTLIKERYTVSKTELTKYHKVIQKFFAGNTEALEKYISNMYEHFKKFNEKLPKVASEKDIVKFSLLQLAYHHYFEDYPTRILDIDEKVSTFFHSAKRTGFLRGIIDGDNEFYKFLNEGTNEKSNRGYVVHPFLLDNELHIFVITVNTDTLHTTQINSYLDNTARDFYDILDKKLGVVNGHIPSDGRKSHV